MSPSINSSRLRRLLGDAAGLGVAGPAPDLAQGLGQWLGAYEAMTLHGALQAVQALATAPAAGSAEWPPAGTVLAGLDAELQRVRTALLKAMAVGAAGNPAGGPVVGGVGAWRGGARAVPVGVAAEPAAAPDYGAFHKRYLDLQRQMELQLGPLRAQVREALSRTSTRLQQLAALDAVLAQTLAPREQRLMAAVPVFLERRYEQLRAAQPAAGGWVGQFEQEFQQVLQAELSTRLQPVVGMMEALGQVAPGQTLNSSVKKTQ